MAASPAHAVAPPVAATHARLAPVRARLRARDAEIVRSSGHARLDEAALATVRATRFRPYIENGVALPFRVVMPLVFELEG